MEKMLKHLFCILVKRSFDELYKSVQSGETRVALVDIFSTPQHRSYYDKYTLYVATVLNEPVIYGAVLPNGTETIRKCFLSYHDNHQLEIHAIVEKFLKSEQVRQLTGMQQVLKCFCLMLYFFTEMFARLRAVH